METFEAEEPEREPTARKEPLRIKLSGKGSEGKTLEDLNDQEGIA